MTTQRFSAGADVMSIHPNQIEPAGLALARGFQNDPLATYMIPDPHEREQHLPTHFTAFLRFGYVSGQVYTTFGDPEGAAVWFPPREWESGTEQAAQTGQTDGASDRTLGLPQDAFERFMAVIGALEPLHRRDVPADHYYLALLGVDRDVQGQGVGSRLIQPVLARADAERQPCYLETFNPTNVPFYQRHGFEVVIEDVEPTSGVRFWTCRRNPR